MRHLARLAVATPILALACARPSHTAAPAFAPMSAADSAAQAEPRELAADQQVAHVLNRLAFGPRPGEAAAVRAEGVDRWIARQLDPARIDDAAAEGMVAERYPLTEKPAAELYRDYPPPAATLVRKRLKAALAGDSTAAPTAADSAELRANARKAQQVVAQVQAVKVARAVVSERQLDEVMVDFWENHFNTYLAKGPQARYYQPELTREAIRPFALGSFRDLLGAVAKSPAMLYYLDNWQSRADSTRPTLAQARGGRGGALGARRRPGAPIGPVARRALERRGVDPSRAEQVMKQVAQRAPKGLNENYGRELMELHTLGVDGGYTQQDVIDVARALTGWTLERPAQGGGFVFRPEWHDAGPKTVLGHALPAGRGIEDGEEVLDILARSPSTAHFIAWKLARRFVSDTPPAALVERATHTYLRTDGNIREVVRTIVTSPEFFSRAAYRAKVKSPFEVVVSALRAMNAGPEAAERGAQLAARLGEPLYGHQAPDGWPETGDSWMNTGAILNRINFGIAMAAGRVPGVTIDALPGAAALRSAPRATQVDAMVGALLNGDASPDTRQILLSGDHPLLTAASAVPDDSTDASGGDAMAGAAMRPMRARGAKGDRAARTGPGFANLPDLQGLAQVVGLALGSPEFQRR